ncbi:MAG: FAD-dependent oxidoreductase [Acidimicrobiales bacterium]|nr:FAD-dependent oxidoreductase [Acidimicrobiales bacterium]MYB80537.1 FAD-dependent oxidoreductase [Acidimicrobiales bacterium]MYI12861.1 FAD-dependent oxidoreductase [Acidimicrobiales bacterium]
MPPVSKFEVAVVGRGLIGSAAARHLAEAGHSVALIGPSEPEDYATSSGPFASHYDEGRITRMIDPDPAWSHLAIRSIGRYADIEERSGIGFHSGAGLVYSGADPRADLAHALELDVDAREVTAAEVAERFGIDMTSADSIIFEAAPAGHINPRRMVAAQSRLTAAAGGTVVDAAVSTLAPAPDGVQLTVGSDTVLAGSVLLCTGAWAAELVGVDLPLERSLRTILMAELDDGPTLPSLISRTDPATCEADPRHDIYWVPPIQFPDGRVMLKIGGYDPAASFADDVPTVVDWFRSGGSQDEADDLEARLREFLPNRTILSKDIKPCVVTNTPHDLPWIDWVDDRIAVAVGGCGAAAKSADEIGRLAGTLFTDEGWRDPVLKLESFRPSNSG